MNRASIIDRTKNWIDGTVVGLNLCPFAKSVVVKNQIRYQVRTSFTTEALLQDLIAELKYLVATDPLVVDTSFLIFPDMLADFLQFNEFLSDVDDALVNLNLEGVIQIASFHPRYQFEGTKIDDIENYTNRSPYPMLHLLREDSVEKAIEIYSDTESISERNIETLNNLNVEQIKNLRLASEP